MFEKLLSLLLHAKGGAVATVFVLGTTGALVTATVDNGLTTITITEASATTTGSETTQGGSTTTNTTVTEAILALFNRTKNEEGSTEPATPGNGCSDEAHERNDEMKRVNAASHDARELVRAKGKDAARSADAKELVRDADTEIKDLRQAAVKDIHGTFDCDKDEDETSTGTTTGTTSTTTTTTTATLTGDDAEAIADKAIEDMEKVVADLEAALEGLEDSDETTTADEKQNGKSENAKNENKGNENKGKGNGKGRSGGDEDDD